MCLSIVQTTNFRLQRCRNNILIFLLLVMIINVFHIASHYTLPFRSSSLFLFPYWLKLLDCFIFLSSWRSSKWSFPVSRIPLTNSTDPPVVWESFDVSGSKKLWLLLLHFLVLYSVPLSNNFYSDVLMQRYSLHGHFYSPQCHNLSLLFLLCGSLSFVCL